jgi:hypothetical protein
LYRTIERNATSAVEKLLFLVEERTTVFNLLCCLGPNNSDRRGNIKVAKIAPILFPGQKLSEFKPD